MVMTSRVMEKSMALCLQLMVALMLSAAGGSANSVSDMNNSLNPNSSPTSGNVVISLSSSSSAPSTAQSMLEAYLSTLPLNEQNILTTAQQSHHHISTVTVEGGEREKTTAANEMVPSSSSSLPTTRLAFPSTESFSDTQSTPTVINSGQSSSTTIFSQPLDSEQPPIIDEPEHEPLGCGPNTREVNGIQKVIKILSSCTTEFLSYTLNL